jgi:hypothetical protein
MKQTRARTDVQLGEGVRLDPRDTYTPPIAGGLLGEVL